MPAPKGEIHFFDLPLADQVMSSLASAPVIASAVTPTIGGRKICGRSSDATDAIHYEFQWDHSGMKVTKNGYGITGWGRVLRSTSPAIKPGRACRFHLCANNPCEANHSASKYGLVGPPIHLQAVPYTPLTLPTNRSPS